MYNARYSVNASEGHARAIGLPRVTKIKYVNGMWCWVLPYVLFVSIPSIWNVSSVSICLFCFHSAGVLSVGVGVHFSFSYISIYTFHMYIVYISDTQLRMYAASFT